MTYQFKIQLTNVNNPVVWRQITLPQEYTFQGFHQAILIAFGWKESDYDFQFYPEENPGHKIRSIYRDINGDEQYAGETLLSDIFTHEGQSLVYVPDNGWEHKIILEKILDGKTRTPDCLSGEGAHPPEYCNGPDDYADMKRILADKTHPEYEATRIWLDLDENGDWEEIHKFDSARMKEQMKHVYGGPEIFRDYHFIAHDAFDDMYGLNPTLWTIIDNKNIRVKQGKKGIIGELDALAHKYPEIPHFKNMLATALIRSGNTSRFLEIEQQLFEDFPDYVMGRCNLISHFSTNNQLDKALELLGEKLDLSMIYPGRNGGFTELEVYSYHAVAFQYLIEKDDVEEAEKHLDFLQHFFPQRTEEEKLSMKLLAQRMKHMPEQLERNKTEKVEVIPEKISLSNEAPVFTHPEVEVFYREGVFIDRDTLHGIMELPRETLIEDMKKMLIDSIARQDYFYEMDWTDETHTFPLHALFVLSSLRSEEGLDAFFTVMRQNEEYLDFWYSDLVTEEFWHFAYLMGDNRLDRLKDFILEPNRYTFVRTAISEAVKQIALHQSQRRPEVLDWYHEVLQYMIDHQDENGLIEEFVYASALNDLIDIAGKEDWKFIRQCYDQLYYEDCYSLEEAKMKLAGKSLYEVEKSDIHTSVDQFYDDMSKWASYNTNKNDQYSTNNQQQKPYEPHIAKPKVGRNDPCPCGSGKKYKKCCGG